MKLVVFALDVIRGFSVQLASSLYAMAVHINVWAQKEHHTDGTHGAISITGLTFNGSTQTTVGAAGGASALPATPSGYLVFLVGTTEYVMPFYEKV